MNIGLIGFGGAGTAHYNYWHAVKGCRPAAVWDPKPAGLERAGRLAPELRATANLDEFWDGLDAVSICTPDETHADLIVAALERGIHVLCEKPLTDSYDGVRKILAAEGTSKARLAVLHQMRFVPLFRRMKERIDAGDLGTVAYLEGYYVHDLTVRAFAYDDWRKEGRATPLVYAGCHFVDLLRWLTGEEPVEIFSAANHRAFPAYPEADLTISTLRFPSTILGKVLVSIGTAGHQDHSVRVYGDRATINNNLMFGREGEFLAALHRPAWLQPELLRYPGLPPWKFLTHLRRILGVQLLAASFSALRRFSPANNEYGAQSYPVRLYEHQGACIAAVADFVESIRSGRPPVCTARDSARTVLACLAGLESARTNRPTAVRTLEEVLASGK